MKHGATSLRALEAQEGIKSTAEKAWEKCGMPTVKEIVGPRVSQSPAYCPDCKLKYKGGGAISHICPLGSN